MKRFIPPAAVLSVALLAPGLAGASAPTVPTAGSAFAAKLDQLPASLLANENVMLTYVDASLVWERFGVGTDPAERLDQLGVTFQDAATFSRLPSLFGDWAADVEGAVAEVGFSTFEIDREAALIAPPNRVLVVDTSVSATDVADAVATDPVWSADLQTVESDAGPYWTWGDDPMAPNVTQRSPMRSLGQGGALALVGDDPATVIRTVSNEDAEAAMRTVAGTDASVAEAGPFAAMVSAVGDTEVVQANGTTAMATVMPPLGGEVAEISEALESAIRFMPYSSVTVVETVEGGEYGVQIIVTHVDPAVAEANAEAAATWLAEGIDDRTGEPIADLLPGTTVSTEGSVLRLTLPSGTYRTATSMLLSGTLLPV